MPKIYPKVDLFHLMKVAAEECKSFGVSMGMMVGQQVLIKIAERAIELQDKEMLGCLYRLCIIKSEDKEEIEQLESYIELSHKEEDEQ